ncbi:LuxR C-terminal-related transcriptional regulator [Novosphingobium terrae]|uniref:LuxR C-terminal-related transcriptional regulator n=1 Tax=Novosphingobium terrae TaxID=2726189 RepID=UPI001F12DE0C|nr:LuxR C-terminal-related transcriptional regulator [Novosphingobium terrae]
MSAKEIARHVDLAPRTVERYIENMRLKMHARNSAHMVACGLFYGAINMPS